MLSLHNLIQFCAKIQKKKHLIVRVEMFVVVFFPFI